MSEDSKETNLNRTETESAVSENDACKTNKKLKRNYCYVCNIQCTALKNLLVHEQGKKHLKNLSLAEEEKKRKDLRNKKKSQKCTIESTRCLKPGENKSTKSKGHDHQHSSSVTDNSTSKIMNNSNKHVQKNKKYEYINPSYENKYSRYQNAKYAYSKNYGHQDFGFNTEPYCNYPRWNNSHSSNAPFRRNTSYHNYTNTSYGNDYFSGNRHAVYNSNDSFGRNAYSRNTENSVQSSHSSLYEPYNFEITDEIPFESSSLNLENTDKSNRKGYSGKTSSASKEATHSKQSITVCVNNSATSAVDIAKDNANIPQSLPLDNITKLRDKKRTRSRSLSSSENLNSEKKIKEKDGNQSIDSDSASEEQRIKEWTDSLLDTSHNQISRLLHPSNYKEKAAVNHLITKFSKSKRKENLTRKLRSNSLGSSELNDDDTEDVNSSGLSLNTEESDEISIVLESKTTPSEQNLSLEQSNNSPSTLRKAKNSAGNDSDQDSNQQSSKQSNREDERSKENASSLSKKSPVKRKGKSTESVNSEKSSKRKNLGDKTYSKGKKQKVYSPKCFERSPSCEITELQEFNNDIPTRENSPNPPDILKTTNSTISTSDTLPEVKEDAVVYSDANPSVCSTDTIGKDTLHQTLGLNSEISVESLIQLFASGSVKVKEEFNDPVMDAIKEISPDELINALSNQPFLKEVEAQSKTPIDSNKRNSRDNSILGTSVEEKRDSISPVIFGSAVIDEDTPFVSATMNNFLSNVSSNKSENQSLLSLSNGQDKSNNSSLTENLNLLDKAKSELPPHLNKLIKQLQEISSQEELVKQNLLEAKSKISEYNFLLEEWKYKKKKLQDEEENLRKQRNDIINLMQNAVKAGADNGEKLQSSPLPEAKTTNDQRTTSKTPNSNFEDKSTCETSYNSSISVSVPEKSQKQKKSKTLVSSEFDEITILPAPVKAEPPEIIIFDDAEDNVPVTQDNRSNARDSGNELVTNAVSNDGSSMFDVKNITAHTTVINCLVVFEDFLYTCSNDNTAKRFSLKDAILTVTYIHTTKNVTEIVVEKVQNEALVFTSCSARVISLFIASSGTKIKTFFPPCAVMSICKGWGKFYCGLASGSVNVYNWKYEEREVVKTESPASRIATAHQGRLHVLVILSSDGNIAIRDAETGLLIRYIKICVKHPSWMTVYNDLAYLSSSDKSLIILDIMSGRVEKRLYLNSHSTGLAVYEDYIFTISYSGLINCFNKDKSYDKKLYYGAGRNGLTCVHVYQNWVFTGNRKGNVSLFQFDQCSVAACEFGKCDILYGLREDLEYHVEKDHVAKKKNLAKCHWRGCDNLFPKNWDVSEKLNHLKKHIYQRLL